ncbi:hypothetical protein [Micromonospora sp. 067-2]|uniref:hypothetical protein n=1 Tax=Micromonospora sp. 067-2 TaxID=2789270 RepID=UPI003977ED00
MTTDDRSPAETASTVGAVPAGHLPATRPAGRAGRAGRVTVATVAIAVALVAGIYVSRRDSSQAATHPSVPSPQVPAALPWNAALVARTDTTITVYVGTGDARCKELVQPRAAVTEQTDAQVVVEVSARVVDAVDCTTSGNRVRLVVSLRKPLGDRVLSDAASATPPPIYFERNLPDLSSGTRWTPHPTDCSEGWCQGYNGPDGSNLLASASRTAGADRSSPVATIPVGPHQGTVTGAAGHFWTVRWKVGDLTYALQLMPSEGGTFSLQEFEDELARLTWR